MLKARKRKMFIALGILLVIVGALVIWFNISYSPVKKQFQNDVSILMKENQLSTDDEVFTVKDFSHLPTAIQRYIENCGYIGTQKMSYLKMEYVLWSALCNDYQLSPNGIKYPTKFQAVWNYSDGDFVYFDGVISEVSYGYKQSASR